MGHVSMSQSSSCYHSTRVYFRWRGCTIRSRNIMCIQYIQPQKWHSLWKIINKSERKTCATCRHGCFYIHSITSVAASSEFQIKDSNYDACHCHSMDVYGFFLSRIFILFVCIACTRVVYLPIQRVVCHHRACNIISSFFIVKNGTHTHTSWYSRSASVFLCWSRIFYADQQHKGRSNRME